MMKYLTQYLDASSIPWRLFAGVFLMSVLLGMLYFIKPFNPAFFDVLYRLVGVFYPLLMALLCFRGALSLLKKPASSHAERRTGQRFVPALLGIALLIITIAQAVWVYRVLNIPQPSEFLTDCIFLSMYSFFICALLLLPSYSLSVLLRLRILFDSLIIMATVATFSAYFLLAPFLAIGEITFLVKMVESVFLSADLIMLFCLLLVALRSREAALRPVLIMLGLATIIIFLTHVFHIQALVHRGYNETSWKELLWLNIGWMLILILIMGAGQTVRRILNKHEAVLSVSLQEHTNWSLRGKILLTGGGLVLIVGLLVLAVRAQGAHGSSPEQIAIVSVGGFIILLLLVLRQFLAIYEVSTLQQVLQQKNRSLNLLNVQFAQQATTDSLTNLPNHRAVINKLDDELAQAQLHHTCCSIIFMDIDYFKNINDLYGHQIGDTILQATGALMKSTLREDDCIGRWGGEEFMAVLPGTDEPEAFIIAELMRWRIEQQNESRENPRVTCSLGVATYPHDATERADLIVSADTAMYAAKHLGRNQTRTAHEPTVLAIGMTAETLQKQEEAEMLGMVETLLSLQETRNQAAGQHARDVASLSVKLALAMGLDDTEAYLIGLSGLLHDLGKVTLPDAILFKQGNLTDDEQALVAQHPVIGAEILSTVPALYLVASLVRAHHERMDGSGYPDGLKGDEIPLGARIVSVADAYDTLTTHHTSSLLNAPTYQLDVLREQAGSQFDPYVVETLVKLFSPDPQRSVSHAA